MGDFNANNQIIFYMVFFLSDNLKSLIKKHVCFKNPGNTTCMDLILTNRQKFFQNSTIIETELFDFHKSYPLPY